MAQDRIGAPPPPPRKTGNLEKPTEEQTRDLNFKVPREFHRRFKLAATALDIQMRDLLINAFEEYVERHKSELRGVD